MTFKTIRLIADSTCDLPSEYIRQHKIAVIPAFVNYGGKSYADDGVELDQPPRVDEARSGVHQVVTISMSDLDGRRRQGESTVDPVSPGAGARGARRNRCPRRSPAPEPIGCDPEPDRDVGDSRPCCSTSSTCWECRRVLRSSVRRSSVGGACTTKRPSRTVMVWPAPLVAVNSKVPDTMAPRTVTGPHIQGLLAHLAALTLKLPGGPEGLAGLHPSTKQLSLAVLCRSGSTCYQGTP